jgi:hypothetical protein
VKLNSIKNSKLNSVARTQYPQTIFRGGFQTHTACCKDNLQPPPPVKPIFNGEAQELVSRSARTIQQSTTNHSNTTGHGWDQTGAPWECYVARRRKLKKARTNKAGKSPAKAKIKIHSQRVGSKGTDQCGFQSGFLVSVMVRKEWTKL